ncbi:hypothetical protein [Parablautia sp. Marseille-Q6255]|uniref:hypothetical protein n=1 Tax=Parablautia sp. Marseille-Q6255 TaxID=3039593 RepID=UPI0024BD4B21|nr:hypothetical protein [Parablautia sp. Marseille-Q6255]
MAEIIKIFLKPDIMIICVVVCLLVVGRLVFKMKYASVRTIILNYVSCFKKRDGGIMLVPIIYYFGIPLIIALGAVKNKRMDASILNIVTIIVSILTAMLFTLLTMIIDMKSKIQQNPNYYSMDAHISKRSLIQTYYAVMFAILLSIVILIFCLFNVFVKQYSYLQSFIVYYLVFLLLITLFMILKRIYRVIDVDMNK